MPELPEMGDEVLIISAIVRQQLRMANHLLPYSADLQTMSGNPSRVKST